MTEEYRKAVYSDGSKKEFEEIRKGDVFYVEEPTGEIVHHPDGLFWMIADEGFQPNVIEAKGGVVAHYIAGPDELVCKEPV